MVGAVITLAEAQVLRDKLLAHRAQLLVHAVRQVEADPHSLGWLRMVADVQSAITALEVATGKPAP